MSQTRRPGELPPLPKVAPKPAAPFPPSASVLPVDEKPAVAPLTPPAGPGAPPGARPFEQLASGLKNRAPVAKGSTSPDGPGATPSATAGTGRGGAGAAGDPAKGPAPDAPFGGGGRSSGTMLGVAPPSAVAPTPAAAAAGDESREMDLRDLAAAARASFSSPSAPAAPPGPGLAVSGVGPPAPLASLAPLADDADSGWSESPFSTIPASPPPPGRGPTPAATTDPSPDASPLVIESAAPAGSSSSLVFTPAAVAALPSESQMSASPTDPLVGTIISDRYKLVERVGSGGMAAVYRAEHQLLKKPVAVKVLLPELAVDKDMEARFKREAVASARLDHPNCVAITDFGQTPKGQLFLVMEYLEGAPLSDIVGYGKRLPWERSVEITRQILRGLARAHEMGIVHRDLKASNVMISPQGGRDIAKIIDFGIAKIFDNTQTASQVLTQAGVVFGTADFLAPERLLGKGDTDPRSDLYSVGIMLYEMLTGTRPFHADDPYEIVKRALSEAPVPPGQVAPDANISPELEAVVLKALEKEPENRYPSAKDFLQALDPIGKRAISTTGYLAGKAKAAPQEPGGLAAPIVSPLLLQPTEPNRAAIWKRYTRRQLAIFAGIGAVPILIIILALAFGGGEGKPPLGAAGEVQAAGVMSAGAADVDKLVKLAGEGDTVAIRQAAFDKLVALGMVDRVPWTDKLTRDLAQLETCEERREVVIQLRNLKDPAALPAIQTAMAKPENACLKKEASAAVAALGGTSDSGTASDSTSGSKSGTRKSGSGSRRRSGGGHF